MKCRGNRKHLQLLKDRSPVRVIERQSKYMRDVLGCFRFVGLPSRPSCGNGIIRVRKCLSIGSKICVLAHEIGHAVCYLRKCKCISKHFHGKSHLLAEQHAHASAIRILKMLDLPYGSFYRFLLSTNFHIK